MGTSEPRTVAQTLYDHGLTAHPHSQADLLIDDGISSVIAKVKRLMRAPRPLQIERQRTLYPEHAQLYVVPAITPSVLRLSMQYPYTVFIGTRDNDLVWKSERRSLRSAPTNTTQPGPQPWARWAVMRALLAPMPPMSQMQLAHAVGASQGSVSNALRWLDHQVARTPNGWVASDPQSLWNFFLEVYPGVGIARTHWLSIDPPVAQAHRVAAAISSEAPDAQVLLSGDVGADMIAAWRVPIRAVVYSDVAVHPERLGFAAATNQESTLDFVMPDDPTISHTAKLFSAQPVADPLIIASELRLNPAGVEVHEAREHLKQQTLNARREAMK